MKMMVNKTDAREVTEEILNSLPFDAEFEEFAIEIFENSDKNYVVKTRRPYCESTTVYSNKSNEAIRSIALTIYDNRKAFNQAVKEAEDD